MLQQVNVDDNDDDDDDEDDKVKDDVHRQWFKLRPQTFSKIIVRSFPPE